MNSIILNNNDHEVITIDSDTNITIKESSEASLIIMYKDIKCNVNIVVEESSILNVLSFNENSSIDIKYNIDLNKYSNINIAYAEFSLNKCTYNVETSLKEESYANISSSTLVKDIVNFELVCKHVEANAKAEMKNFAVTASNGKYKMVNIGNILKGCSGTTSKQSTKVLTLQDKQSATVEPLLLIDENDVVAAHATSIGMPNQDELFYMQTRGLTYDESLRLLTLGYLLPIVDSIDNETLKKELASKIESKVLSTCLI